MNQSGDNIHLINFGPQRQAAGKFEHIEGLPTGICITAKLKFTGTKQAVKVQMQQPDPHSFPAQTTIRPKKRRCFFFRSERRDEK